MSWNITEIIGTGIVNRKLIIREHINYLLEKNKYVKEYMYVLFELNKYGAKMWKRRTYLLCG